LLLFLCIPQSQAASVGIRAPVFSMASITKGKGNRYATLHDMYDCDELVQGEQEAIWGKRDEEKFKAMRH
jgi:hypothetical protein